MIGSGHVTPGTDRTTGSWSKSQGLAERRCLERRASQRQWAPQSPGCVSVAGCLGPGPFVVWKRGPAEIGSEDGFSERTQCRVRLGFDCALVRVCQSAEPKHLLHTTSSLWHSSRRYRGPPLAGLSHRPADCRNTWRHMPLPRSTEPIDAGGTVSDGRYLDGWRPATRVRAQQVASDSTWLRRSSGTSIVNLI